MSWRCLMFSTVLTLGCAPEVRFADRAILWRDPDDAPIPLPRARDGLLYGPSVRDELFVSADRVLAFDFLREAQNVNALDELPDSSWWVDPRRDPAHPERAPRPLDDEEMARGACGANLPPAPPFTVSRAKREGATAGFVVKDARGRKFMLKLDPPGWTGLATSTEAVASRLVWAGGWRVPKIWLLDLHRDQVRRTEASKTRDDLGKEIPLTREVFDGLMARVPTAPDGSFRAAASLWIEGTIVGPYGYSGRRADDPNDRVEHQNRRDLRGYGVMSSWLNNIDTQEINTLDSYVGKPGEGHLLHYQQDVSGSFGSRAVGPAEYWMGYETYFTPSRVMASLFSFGVPRRNSEGELVERERARVIAAHPELGFFESDRFDARRWSSIVHNAAFDRATARDRYWGAKRVLAVSARELKAAIRVGGYQPATAAHLFDVLWTRRERILRAHLSEVAALDHFRVQGDRLCFDDLWLDAGLGGEAATQYRVAGGKLVGQRCVNLPQRRGYRVVELKVQRAGEGRFGPPVKVHLIEKRIVGVER